MNKSNKVGHVIDRLRKMLSSTLFKYPRLFSVARWIYRRVLFFYNKVHLFLWRGRSPHANFYITVGPSTIRRKSRIASNKFRDTGKVLDGDWDLNVHDFETEYPYYPSIKACLVDGKLWEETELFKDSMHQLRSEATALGCNKDELRFHINYMINLYDDIRINGYRWPKETRFNLGSSDEISIHIGRHGELLFDDGGHRLAISQLLGIKSIPVQVSLRHKQWDAFRRSLIIEAQQNGGALYQRIPHPDLDFIPASHDCSDRLNLIEPHIDYNHGKLLDIGANWGMVCHRMEEIGFDCVAVENDPIHLYFLKKIRNIFSKHFEIYEGSIFEIDCSQYGTFEVVLALNIFHHLIKTKELHDKLVNFLQRLNTRCIFFEPCKDDEFNGQKGRYRNFKEEEFVTFIMKHSRLPNKRVLGRVKDGRAIYKIYT